jgi:hypothetical protein
MVHPSRNAAQRGLVPATGGRASASGGVAGRAPSAAVAPPPGGRASASGGVPCRAPSAQRDPVPATGRARVTSSGVSRSGRAARLPGPWPASRRCLSQEPSLGSQIHGRDAAVSWNGNTMTGDSWPRSWTGRSHPPGKSKGQHLLRAGFPSTPRFTSASDILAAPDRQPLPGHEMAKIDRKPNDRAPSTGISAAARRGDGPPAVWRQPRDQCKPDWTAYRLHQADSGETWRIAKRTR